MCTRFFADIEISPFIEKARHSPIATQMIINLSRPINMTGEIQPTDIAAVIARSKSGKRAVFPMQWGFSVNGLSSPVVNARLESAAEKPTFRDSWQNRRCIIPASWYFEWQHYKTPDGRVKTGKKYAIQPHNADMTYLAGLYRYEEKSGFRYPVFVVLTRSPIGRVQEIHDRMPLILPESAIDEWISPDGKVSSIVDKAITDLVVEEA